MLPQVLPLAIGVGWTAGLKEEKHDDGIRQLVRWIEAPKSEEARKNRIVKAVERVLQGPPKRKNRAS